MKRFLSVILSVLTVLSACPAIAETVMIPPVEVVSEEAFYGTEGMEELVIQEGTRVIESKAFAYSGVSRVSVPSSVEWIAEDAFDGCTGLVADITDNDYAEEWFTAHGFICTGGLRIVSDLLNDEGLLELPVPTAKKTAITIGVQCNAAWTVSFSHCPGTKDWFTLDKTSGTGNDEITLTVTATPGKWSDYTVRDNFATRLTVTDAKGRSTQFIVVIYKEGPYTNTHINTGNYIEDILAVAHTQLGYQGSNVRSDYDGIRDQGSQPGDHTKYGRYMDITDNPWCASFLSWCAFQAGIPTSVMRPSTYAMPGSFSRAVEKGEIPTYFFNYLNDYQHEQYPYIQRYGHYLKRSECATSRGDLIFFRKPTAYYKVTYAHIGIVLDFTDGIITYLDGNGDDTDTVMIRTIEATDPYVAAYVTILKQSK